jgi:hypothetical protein
MAKRYEFWYNVEEAWKASFVADSLEHAKQLLAKAEEEGNFPDVLPAFWEKNKSLDTVIDMNSLEFAGEFDENEEDE